MPTAARPVNIDGSHWYTVNGEPRHTMISKSTGLPRPTTLADARKQNLLPSVTHILRVLHKQALVDWLIEQAVLAAMTTPRITDASGKPESDDAFIYRVLHTERVQDQESQIARDRGTDMHAALEGFFKGEQIDEDLRGWIEPAAMHLKGKLPGAKFVCEECIVGAGYAGRVDLQASWGNQITVVDFKTCKALPKEAAWKEARLQLSAYGAAIYDQTRSIVNTANLYISTVDMGKFVLHENPSFEVDYACGFAPLVLHWQWANQYKPQQ